MKKIVEKKVTQIRQEEIKKAVLKIISEEGLAKLSTRNLAEKVGISEGAIFRHFKTKKDIILSIMSDVKLNMLEGMKKAALQNKPADEKLFDIMCVQIKYLMANNGITILLFSQAAYFNDKDLKKELHSIMSTQKEIISNTIRAGIKEGLWRRNINVDDVVMLYMGIPVILNIELVLNRSGINTENFCKRMYSLFLQILKGTRL